jgi:transposase
MDVHRDFCEAAVGERGKLRSVGRVSTRVESLTALARSLLPEEVVVIEATTGSDRIVSVLESHGLRVVVANTRKLKAISDAKAKTDRSTRARCQARDGPDA